MEKYILSVMVENKSGVLLKVSELFARRGFNIDSLTVCETNITGQSRMTIVVNGDEHDLDQIQKQLSKLPDVISIKICNGAETAARLMALIKVKIGGDIISHIMSLCEIYRARIVDVSATCVIVEATGNVNKIESLLELLKPYGIMEYVKTGLAALDRGAVVMQ